MEFEYFNKDEFLPSPFVEENFKVIEDKQEEELEQGLFSIIPLEILLHVFQFLDEGSLCCVSLVCKEWNYLSKLDEFWKNFYFYRFGTLNIIHTITERSWKTIFSNRMEVNHVYVKPFEITDSCPKPQRIEDLQSKDFKFQKFLFAGETLKSKAYDLYSTDQPRLVSLLLQIAGEEFSSCISIKENIPEVYLKFGSIMAQIGRSHNGQDFETFFRFSFEFYSKASVPEFFMYEHALSFWGDALVDLSTKKDGEETTACLHEACEKLKQSSQVNPDNAVTQYYWGRALHKLATKEQISQKKTEFYLDAHTKLQRAGELTPNDCYILNEHGITLHEFSLTKSAKDAEPYFELAVQKYAQSSELSNPKDSWTLRKWADTYYDWAKLIYCENYPGVNQFDPAVCLKIQSLLKLSLEKYEQALALDPFYINALNSGALAASTLAKILDEEKEVERLFNFAYERFQRAIEASPNDCSIEKCNWAMVMASHAMKKQEMMISGTIPQDFELIRSIFSTAKSTLRSLVQSGDKWACFCMARVCASVGDVQHNEECKYWLEQCHDQKYLQKASFWQLTYFEKVREKSWFLELRQETN